MQKARPIARETKLFPRSRELLQQKSETIKEGRGRGGTGNDSVRTGKNATSNQLKE